MQILITGATLLVSFYWCHLTNHILVYSINTSNVQRGGMRGRGPEEEVTPGIHESLYGGGHPIETFCIEAPLWEGHPTMEFRRSWH